MQSLAETIAEGVAATTNRNPAEEASMQPLSDGTSSISNGNAPVTQGLRDKNTEGNATENPARHGVQCGEQKPKKPKRKNKTVAARGPGALSKNRGTGFEEYYCDPPRTPAEALEEQTEIYSPHRPFVDRIEECLQRFRARRRLDSERSNLFNKFLTLGGIDCSPRQFQGADSIDLDGATTGEARETMASDVIHRTGSDPRYYNPKNPEHWDVDFAGVVAGFFSERIFKLAASNMRLIEVAVNVVHNFLNYVLYHDVCPEYSANIYEAKSICDLALDEVSRIYGVWKDIPDDFGAAAQVLYCQDEDEVSFPRFYTTNGSNLRDLQRAKTVFMATVATMDDDSFTMFNEARASNAVRVVGMAERTFEIVELRYPGEDVIKLYRGVKDPTTGEPGTVDPCGSVILKPTTIQDGWDRGLSSILDSRVDTEETFVLNCNVMRHLLAGMKLRLVVCTLNTGIKFIKEFMEVYPSYYTFLPQELMLTYKEPIANDRPAPTAYDPDAEEVQQTQMNRG